MKKVLFASTALVAGALAAPQFASAQSVSAGNADFTFGGYARWGLLYNDAMADETSITHRWRLQIDASTESDAGVTFGARVRIDNNVGEAANQGTNGPRYFVRSGGFEVGVGNIFGAIDAMPGQFPIDLGLTGLSYDYSAYLGGGADGYSSGGRGSADSNGIEVIYSAGDFTVHASASDTAADRRAIHAAYTFSGFTVALGLQDSNTATDTELTASVSGAIGPANVALAYADNGTRGDRIVLAAQFDVGASTDVGFYITHDEMTAGDPASQMDEEAYGIDFNHNMGGGTSLRGGIEKNLSGATQADLGVRFNF